MRCIIFGLGLVFSSLINAAIPNEVLAVWTNEAIVATYTFDYKDFLSEQKNIAHYFSAKAWMNYTKALNDSGLPETVAKNYFYVSAVATLPPVVTSLPNNQFKAVMPILVNYKNAQFSQQQTLTVTLQFSIAPSGQGLRGFQIDSLQSVVSKPPCVCKTENDKKDAS